MSVARGPTSGHVTIVLTEIELQALLHTLAHLDGTKTRVEHGPPLVRIRSYARAGVEIIEGDRARRQTSR